MGWCIFAPLFQFCDFSGALLAPRTMSPALQGMTCQMLLSRLAGVAERRAQAVCRSWGSRTTLGC